MSEVRRSLDFTAYTDRRQPGPGGPILRVYGVCEMPCAGYVLGLRPLVPQGHNPTILILQLLEQRPPEPAPGLTQTPVFYQQSLEGLRHPILEVHITPLNVKLEVQTVH